MEVKNIAVLGVGTIGYQIAQQAAQNGFQVYLRDVEDGIVARGLETIKKGLQKFFVEKGKMGQEEANGIVARIKGTTDLKEAVRDADVVIEAIPEVMELKKQVFKELDELSSPKTILASNTSGLSITEIGSLTKRQDKIIGTHFFNPVQVMRLLEVVKGANTSEETLNTIKDLAKKLRKEIVVLNDSPGFITTRIILVMINEAIKLIHEGVATAEDVDKAVELGFNMPMGPLKIHDINCEIALHGLEYFRKEFGDAYHPCPLMKKAINAGYLGLKTGKGIRDYKP